jgi:tetratricopeptide (TPR) repeat protein
MGTGGRLAVVILLVSAVARADDLQDAREHYSKATRAYEVGQYDEAIAEFATAYKLKDDPSILFNLAQAHRMGGHRDEALRTYRMFLLKVPDSPNRREVEAIINTLSQQNGSEDPDRELARRYTDAGASKFVAGQYQEAIAEFEKARLVKPTPGLDLSIARGYDKLGRLEEALASYRLYVEARPDAGDAGDIRTRIQTLEERLAATQKAEPPPEHVLPSAPAPVPPTPPAPVPTSRPAPAPSPGAGRAKTIAGMVVGGVGLGAIAGGIASGVLAKQNGDELTQLSRTMGRFSSAKESAGKSDDVAMGVLLGVGGAAVVTGVVLVVLGRREAHHHLALLPSLSPGVAGALLQGSF